MVLTSREINIVADNEVNLTNIIAPNNGGDLFVKGSEVTISSTQYNRINKFTDYDHTDLSAKRRGHETETIVNVHDNFLIGKNISLEADSGDLTLNGVSLSSSKKLSLKAAQDIKTSGVETATIHEKKIKYTAYGSDFKDGINNTYAKYSGLKKSQLESEGNINMSSGRDIVLAGTSVKAGEDLFIDAANNIDINVQITKNKERINKRYTQAGGVAGSEMDYTDEVYGVNHKSSVSGKVVNITALGDVAITASEISSISQGNISGDNVIFSGVLNDKHLNSNISTGGVLNVITDSSKKITVMKVLLIVRSMQRVILI
ncbi:hemagglutinin repeat-containing protein [Yersinia intermedia]|nr:hemagglutinin repeat-containing protein [Yersinia intermedia]